ncbi:uncharacterized protein LOC105629380 [Jatropha curcas]|uniref:uncharacterized protein LOC105629380 n=1 Tax=Jatropha curcas TaxID=180498 RepID=UPI0018936A7E|nr:uncharacterized protein LOC105629380 [Jatropha curcas]XP_037493631.1 uncharacterized protein LOC105629380 [Jatropha curcas]
MAATMKQIVAKSIKLAEEVIVSTKGVRVFKDECYEIKSNTRKLAAILREMVAQASSKFYERPVRIIIDETERVLQRALSLVLKFCNNSLMKRILTIVSASEFRLVSCQLQFSVRDVSWLHRLLFSSDDHLGIELSVPPIASNDPLLARIWAYIGALYNGSIDGKHEAANELLSLSQDCDLNKKLIIQEGGVVPLLKLLKEGRIEAQVIAAKVIGTLGFDSKSVQRIIDAGACLVFVKILKEGSMKVQTEVSWTISNLAAKYPTCQGIFGQSNIVRLLINHLASGVVQEHVPNAIVINKATSVLAIVMARNHLITSKAIEEYYDDKPREPQQQNVSLSGTSFKGGEIKVENEDPETKANMKVMAARALCNLLKGNPSICRTIIDSRALMSFIVLLDEGNKDVQYHSATALMEITAIVEEDSDLRRTTFRHSSPVCKIVVDQLVKILQREDQDLDLLIPCIKSIGNLAKTFRVAEARIITPLVNLLDDIIDVEVLKEALITLAKFACKENNLHHDHSKKIIQAGGAKNLISLIVFKDQIVQHSALLLLCYITLHVPNSEELVQHEVLKVLEWASKQSFVTQDETFDSLLPEARAKLEHFQFSRVEQQEYTETPAEIVARYNITEIINATQKFSPKMKVGKDGHFGIVYKAELPNLTVAVKKLFPQSKKAAGIRAEVLALSNLENQNLVKLLGSYSKRGLHLLIYEYMDKGSLEQALFGPHFSLPLNWEIRYRICQQIAQGLEYIHNQEPPIIHRSINASNILLYRDYNAKISDFGLANLYEENDPFTFIRAGRTLRYMAPEYAVGKEVTVKSDVYSFGILLLEILSGIKMDTNLGDRGNSIYLLDKAFECHKQKNYEELVDEILKEYRLWKVSSRTLEQAITIIKLAMLCIDRLPSNRPAMSNVVSVLQGKITVKDIADNVSSSFYL